MVKIAVLIANGSEEIETLTPVDLFRRCDGAICDLISVSGKTPTCSHGVCVTADKVIEEIWKYVINDCIKNGAILGNANAKEDTSYVSVAQSEKMGLTKVAEVRRYSK